MASGVESPPIATPFPFIVNPPEATFRYGVAPLMPVPVIVKDRGTVTSPFVAMESEDVPAIEFVPSKYATCPVAPVYKDEVAMESVPDVPPTNAPRVPECDRPKPKESEVVATD
jgi:hypothetical protein